MNARDALLPTRASAGGGEIGLNDRTYVPPAQVSVGGKKIYLNAGVLPTPTLRTETLREIN